MCGSVEEWCGGLLGSVWCLGVCGSEGRVRGSER